MSKQKEKSLIRKIELNQAEFRLSLGKNDESEERIEKKVKWIIGGGISPSFNCVIDAQISKRESNQIIKESINQFREHAVSGTWQVGESARPKDLSIRLEQHQFKHIYNLIGMAAKTSKVINIPRPEHLTIKQVESASEIDRWANTLQLGFGNPSKKQEEWMAESYKRVGVNKTSPWRLFTGYINDKPVAVSALFISNQVAGIYFIATIPEARKQGVGAAMTLAAISKAKEQKVKLCVLQATEMGYPVYKLLGFEEFCKIGFYQWNSDL